MISVELARRLRDAGVRWTPARGDRFVVADRGMDGDVFVLSDMTVEVHNVAQSEVIGFNGTTEWALDSIDQEHAVWLPREEQLRDLLGGTFRSLHREADGRWRVVTQRDDPDGQPPRHEDVDVDAETAYARALARLVTGEDVAVPLTA